MVRYTYVLLGIALAVLVAGLIFLANIEAPLIERAGLPKCSNGVVIDSELRYNIINYSNQRIIQGTGQSYFDSHFVYKNLDYSESDCVFTVRYEFVYYKLHKEMSLSIRVFSKDNFEIINTNTFLRPVNVLVSEKEAVDIANAQGIDYSYYNLEIDVEQQTFRYRFYEEMIPRGSKLVMSIDAQSKEIIAVQDSSRIIPLV